MHVIGITRDILGYKNNTILPSLATGITDATLGASGPLLGIRTGAGGTATLTESSFGRSPWLHGQQVYGYLIVIKLTII